MKWIPLFKSLGLLSLIAGIFAMAYLCGYTTGGASLAGSFVTLTAGSLG
jgi:hypothetical protein